MLVILAASDVNGVGGREVRSAAVNIRDCRPVATNGRGKILSSNAGALIRVPGMTEICVSIDVNEARVIPERKPSRHKNAAVTSDHQRCPAVGDDSSDSAREATRVVDQLSFVSHVAGGASDVVVDVAAGKDNTSVDSAACYQPAEQTRLSQCFGCLGRARHASPLGGSKPQFGGRRHYRDHAPTLSGPHNDVDYPHGLARESQTKKQKASNGDLLRAPQLQQTPTAIQAPAAQRLLLMRGVLSGGALVRSR